MAKAFQKNFMQRRDRGASLIEYALLVALIAVIGVASIKSLGFDVAMTSYHAQAALEAGAGQITNPWCQAHGSDSICQ